MLFTSTGQKIAPVSFREAVLTGLAKDGGLYVPEFIPKLPTSFFDRMPSLSFQDLSYEVAQPFLAGDISDRDIQQIIAESLTFDAPLVPLREGMYALELFHGPTFAFKDFGARFMARVLSHFNRDADCELTILVATSGDTGSAVAHGFYGVDGIRVVLLYPQGKVSLLQEKQMTTLNGNVTALEIQGTFDDCQRLVKTAFQDSELNQKLRLSSANSINIARLIPQTFYYFQAVSRLNDAKTPVVFSVPCGNFGNLTAGIFAKRMGLPVSKFVAATNVNDMVPAFLKSGLFRPRPSIATVSNAMDVGNPSNFSRMLSIYTSVEKMRDEIWGVRFSDDQTKKGMKNVYEESGYILDPHGAVGYLGLNEYLLQNNLTAQGIFLETAHPAKFNETVREAIGHEIPIPPALGDCLTKPSKTTVLSSRFEDFKSFLLD